MGKVVYFARVAGGRPMNVDRRVYTHHPGCSAAVKPEGPPMYCHRAEEHGFHLIASGEVYVVDGDANYCLNCGLDLGILTRERPSLDRGNRVPQNP
jgi:hypothetical protein